MIQITDLYIVVIFIVFYLIYKCVNSNSAFIGNKMVAIKYFLHLFIITVLSINATNSTEDVVLWKPTLKGYLKRSNSSVTGIALADEMYADSDSGCAVYCSSCSQCFSFTTEVMSPVGVKCMLYNGLATNAGQADGTGISYFTGECGHTTTIL